MEWHELLPILEALPPGLIYNAGPITQPCFQDAIQTFQSMCQHLDITPPPDIITALTNPGTWTIIPTHSLIRNLSQWMTLRLQESDIAISQPTNRGVRSWMDVRGESPVRNRTPCFILPKNNITTTRIFIVWGWGLITHMAQPQSE